jgi:NADPH:quinone reductase-like Zn-dependent oxidoreductase
MSDDETASRADAWLWNETTDPDEAQRAVVLERRIKKDRRAAENWRAVKEWSVRIGAGGIIGSFLYQIADKMGWL